MVVVDIIILVVRKDDPGFMKDNRQKQEKNRLKKSSYEPSVVVHVKDGSELFKMAAEEMEMKLESVRGDRISTDLVMSDTQ